MSWQEVLGAGCAQGHPYTQNPHKTQNGSPAGDSACSADSAHKGIADEAEELLAELGASPDECAAWQRGAITIETLRAAAAARIARSQRELGEVPHGWTHRAECAGCGPVWLWPGAPAQVDGCPWCWNRARGLPVPHAPA